MKKRRQTTESHEVEPGQLYRQVYPRSKLFRVWFVKEPAGTDAISPVFVCECVCDTMYEGKYLGFHGHLSVDFLSYCCEFMV